MTTLIKVIKNVTTEVPLLLEIPLNQTKQNRLNYETEYLSIGM